MNRMLSVFRFETATTWWATINRGLPIRGDARALEPGNLDGMESYLDQLEKWAEAREHDAN